MRKIKEGYAGQRFITISASDTDTMSRNPLTKGVFVTSMGYFPKARYHYFQRPKGWDDYILFYCTEGCGTVAFDNHVYKLEAEQYIVVPKGVPHYYGSDEEKPWTIYWVCFRGTNAEYMCRDMYKPCTITEAHDSRKADRIALFEELHNTLNGAPDLRQLEYSSVLLQHFIATFSHITAFRYQRSGYDIKSNINIIRQATHYLEEHLESNVTINQLAAWCGRSRSYIYRTFVKDTGQSPTEYYMRLKINSACLLLTHTRMSIIQIAEKFNFSDSQHFSRTFRKVMGTTPTDYRKHYFLTNME